MEIKKGSSRIAVCGKNFTAKVPYFPPDRLQLIPEDLRIMWKMNGWKGLVEYFTDPEDFMCFQQRFLDGWLANIREALWSRSLGDTVVPTHFSLAGILNIQSTAECLGLDIASVREAVKAEIRDRIGDSHTFLSPDNYGRHNDQIKLLDYGSRGAGDFVRTHRAAFRRALTSLTKKSSDK
jgi:hypothetical protein